MGNYENLKQSITEVIRTNGNQEITGAVLQSTLLTIISTVGANATFAGIATPITNPGTPDGPVFYLASESGTYTNFDAIELQDGLSVLMWNGTWSSQQVFSIDDVRSEAFKAVLKNDFITFQGTIDVSFNGYTASVTLGTSSANKVGYYASLDRNVAFENENSEATKTYTIDRLQALVIDTTTNKLRVVDLGSTYTITKECIIIFRNPAGDIYSCDGYLARALQTSEIRNNITTNKSNIISDFCRGLKVAFQGTYQLVENSDNSVSITINSISSQILRCGYVHVQNGVNRFFYNTDDAQSVTYNVPRTQYLGIVWSLDGSGNIINGTLQVLQTLAANCTPIFYSVAFSLDQYLNNFGNLAQGNDILIYNKLNEKIDSVAAAARNNINRNDLITFQATYSLSFDGQTALIRINSNITGGRAGYYVDVDANKYFYNEDNVLDVTYEIPRLSALVIDATTSKLKVVSAGSPSEITKSYIILFRNYGGSLSNADGILANRLNVDEIRTGVTGLGQELFYNFPTRLNGSAFYLVARQGYGNYPNQSLYAYDNALKNGYNTLLIDVMLTSDGYFVASHDATINAQARNPDGTIIEEDFTIAGHTLAEINYYDFGIRYGSQYAGMNIPLVEDFIKFCGLRNCPFILEFKVIPPDEKITEIGLMLRKYNVEKLAIIHGAETAVEKFSIACPYSPLGFSVGRITQAKINQVLSYQLANNNEIWLYIGNYLNPLQNTLDDLDDYLEQLVTNNIKLGYTEIQSTSDLDTLKGRGYLNVFKYLAFKDPETFRTWLRTNW